MIYKDKNLVVVSNSVKGKKRNTNQDDILIVISDFYYLFVLFDGVSSIKESIDFISQCKSFIVKNHLNYYENQSLQLNKIIFDSHTFSSLYVPNGRTTCSALVIYRNNNKYDFVNIGDSRIYTFSTTYLNQITTDDTIKGYKNFITKSIGDPYLKIDDINIENIFNESCFLICSDGFYSLMENKLKEYFQTLHYKYPKNIINRFLKIQDNQNNDDSTYLLIKNYELFD